MKKNLNKEALNSVKGGRMAEPMPIADHFGPDDQDADKRLNLVGNQLQQSGFDRNVYKVTHNIWNTMCVGGKIRSSPIITPAGF